MASSYQAMGNLQQALDCYQQAIAEGKAAGKTVPPMLRAYGLLLQEAATDRQGLHQGLQWILRGLIKPPGEVLVAELLDLATGQVNCADWAGAAATLSEALALEPANRSVKFQIARLAELQSDYSRAIGDYRALLAEDSSLQAVRLNLGNCLVAAARGALAPQNPRPSCGRRWRPFRACWRVRSLRANPWRRSSVWPPPGICRGSPRAAVAILDEALEAAPHHPLLRFNRANILQDMGEMAAAIAGFRALVELYPDYHDARWNSRLCRARERQFSRRFS